MLIVEDISYSIDDVIESLRDELGFSYVEETENEGYINLGQGIKLNITFSERSSNLDSAKLIFPRREIEIRDDKTAEVYSVAIESAEQVVDLIDRMLGGNKDEEDID